MVKMVGIESFAENGYSSGVFSDFIGELFGFVERAVNRPQFSFSLEDRGARPDFVV